MYSPTSVTMRPFKAALRQFLVAWGAIHGFDGVGGGGWCVQLPCSSR